MKVCLRLLGSPVIESAGESVALPFERRNQLLAYLALKRAWVPRAELAAMLWPEQDTRLAYANLRKILFRLQSLPWAGAVEAQVGALRFEADTDVADFETALREQRLADALALRRGELMSGYDDDGNEAWTSWLGFERDRLRVAWRTAAIARAEANIDPAEGIEITTRLLDADPLDEAALRVHMGWLARSGQSARARQAYRDFAARLEDDLGLGPGAELTALHDTLGVRPAAAPPRAAGVGKAGRGDDGFVGRQVELRRIAERMAQDDCRLLCLVGPGGVGKTRLARRALDELGPGYDGVAFVPLEDIADAAEIGGRLAREIGLAPSGNRDPVEQAIEFLGERRMLLVLDNFEQLAAAAPVLQRLLDACAGVKMLVTSRVRLGLATEWLLPVEGLPAPEMEDQDRIEAFDAVRLFVNAAHRVEPALIPSAEAAAIIEICALVDGLPLALELAAAWTRVLSCESIAAELRLGTELLRADGAGRPARHASVDVVFDHSWQLLSPVERDALARLSVFRGGFSAEAARAVAAASLPVIGALADKSLLRKDETRIHLHPLVQQLASARLADDARAAAEEAHALHFHRLLRQLRPAAEKGERAALRQLDIDFENCRVAWRWAIGHGAADLLRRSAESLFQFCDYLGHLDTAMSLVDEALDAPVAQTDAPLEGMLRSKSSHLLYRLNRYADAETEAQRALALAGAGHGSDDARLTALKVLGGCSLRLARYAEARRHYRKALQLGPAHTHPRNAATMTDHLALVEKNVGDYDAALRLSLDALAQHRRIGDAGAEALCLNNLAALYLDRKEYDSARAHVREALAICDRHGIASTRTYLLANLAEIAVETNDNAAAATYAAQALEAAESTANRAVTCWMRLQLARLAVRRGDCAAARSELADGVSVAATIRIPALLIAGAIVLSEICEAEGDRECARRLLAFALAQPALQPQLRETLAARLASWPPTADATTAWPSLTLDELVHRIVVETPLAHAPLLALVRAAR